MNFRKLISAAAVATLMIASGGAKAQSYDWAVLGGVTSIEATYMPNTFRFALNVAAGSCAAGTYLTWNGVGSTVADQQANVKAVYAMVLTAKVAGGGMRIYGTNAGCTVTYVYFG